LRDPGNVHEDIEAVGCEYRNGSDQLRRRQLFKRVISNRCGWALIVFAFQDWRTTGHVKVVGWQPVRWSIERWHRVAERWRLQSRLTMNQADAAAALELVAAVDASELAAVADASAAA
jgi:hypothetical protein